MTTKRLQSLIFILFFSTLATFKCFAVEKVQAVTYSPHAFIESCHMNMGPTGATAWMKGNHFVIASIDQESPCHGYLELGDVVVGANGIHFDENNDLRMTLGNAIEEAEKENNKLVLDIYRKGNKIKISFKLPTMGSYSETWPYNCDKSKNILDAACNYLLYSQLPNGRYVSDGNFDTYSSGLLLLASGNPKYFDAARRTAHYTSTSNFDEIDYNSWALGYGGIFLAEYYLATGDITVLDNLNKVVTSIAKGQMKCGSWGHKSPGGGYGALNQPGLMCALALILAKECGIKIDQNALDKSLQFFGRYSKLGSIPYGDHFPGGSPDDNGKNSLAALLMKFAGHKEQSNDFSKSVAMSYFKREDGHTGGLFSITWGPLATALQPNKSFNKFMNYQKWYYNLCRTWKGNFILLPYLEALTRFDSAGYSQLGPDMCTSTIGLAFALPQKKLRITGAPRSIFGASLTGELQQARGFYQTKKWQAFDKAIAHIDKTELNDQEKQWLTQLEQLSVFNKKSTLQTLTEIDSNLINQAVYRASEQFKSLKVYMGGNGHQSFDALEKRFSSGPNPWYIREAEKHYQTWSKFLTNTIMTWVPTGTLSKKFINGLSTLRHPIWEPLSPTSQFENQQWRSIKTNSFEDLPKNWTSMAFDDSNWHLEDRILSNANIIDGKSGIASRRVFKIRNPKGHKLRVRLQTVRRALTKVYLNGQLIIDIVRGQRGGYAVIELDNSVFKILNKGNNILAVISNAKDSKSNKLDLGLEINRYKFNTRTLPRMKTKKFIHTHLPDTDSNLYVSRERNKYLKKLEEAYASKSDRDLITLLANDTPYIRSMVQKALFNKGYDSVKIAFENSNQSDWRIASSIANLPSIASHHYKRILKTPEAFEAYDTFIPKLIELSKHEHLWVKVNAIKALSLFGEKAVTATDILIAYLDHPHEWVRSTAIKTLQSAVKDQTTLAKIVNKGLKKHGTSYGVPATAMNIIKSNKKNNGYALESLLHFISHPPEGGGGRFLNEAIVLSCKMDPSGQKVIPVLIDCVADKTHCSRQRGNPRNKAINALATYGNKAISALPTLNAILASEVKKDSSQHTAATAALNAILGNKIESEPNP